MGEGVEESKYDVWTRIREVNLVHFGNISFSVWFARTRSNKLAAFDLQCTIWSLAGSFDKSFVICMRSHNDKFIWEKIIKNTICNILHVPICVNIYTADRCIIPRNKSISFQTRYYQEQNTRTRNNENTRRPDLHLCLTLLWLLGSAIGIRIGIGLWWKKEAL